MEEAENQKPKIATSLLNIGSLWFLWTKKPAETLQFYFLHLEIDFRISSR